MENREKTDILIIDIYILFFLEKRIILIIIERGGDEKIRWIKMLK